MGGGRGFRGLTKDSWSRTWLQKPLYFIILLLRPDDTQKGGSPAEKDPPKPLRSAQLAEILGSRWKAAMAVTALLGA